MNKTTDIMSLPSARIAPSGTIQLKCVVSSEVGHYSLVLMGNQEFKEPVLFQRPLEPLSPTNHEVLPQPDTRVFA